MSAFGGKADSGELPSGCLLIARSGHWADALMSMVDDRDCATSNAGALPECSNRGSARMNDASPWPNEATKKRFKSTGDG